MNIDSVINKLISKKPRITSVVGSGISKASGMPTFRGKDGLWKNYSAQDLATPYAFSRDPNLVWNWYRWRMRALLEAQPNPAHKALVRLEKAGLSRGIITQNVDGLHEIAGNNPNNLIEIHGRIRYARCMSCKHIQRWDNNEFAYADDDLPFCPKCKDSLLRPDVVWFGESLDTEKWQKAIEWVNHSNILLVIGTSAVVQPVASLPILAKENGSTIIEFNIEETPITEFCDYSLFGPSEQTLPEFVKRLMEKVGEGKE